jgi:hypothetical protein
MHGSKFFYPQTVQHPSMQTVHYLSNFALILEKKFFIKRQYFYITINLCSYIIEYDKQNQQGKMTFNKPTSCLYLKITHD